MGGGRNERVVGFTFLDFRISIIISSIDIKNLICTSYLSKIYSCFYVYVDTFGLRGSDGQLRKKDWVVATDDQFKHEASQRPLCQHAEGKPSIMGSDTARASSHPRVM